MRQGVVLPTIGKDRFRLGSDVLDIPTFDTVDGFVRELVRNGNVEDNRVVASIVSGPASFGARRASR